MSCPRTCCLTRTRRSRRAEHRGAAANDRRRGTARQRKTSAFPVTGFGIDGFNIDDRCAQILGSYRAIPRDVRRAVAKECERFVEEHIASGRSFAVETTLRTAAAIDQARRARTHGFATELNFIATDSIAVNVERVLQRAQGGGHGASEREIRAIHEASISNLAKAIDAFEVVDIYDSTSAWVAPRLVATARSGKVVRLERGPAWLDQALAGSRQGS